MSGTYDLAETTENIGGIIENRVNYFYEYIWQRGYTSLWRRSYYQYYAGYFNGGLLQAAGEDGELVEISINDYRNIIQHLCILITSGNPKWSARAINTDKKSQLQSILIPALMEYYEKHGGGEGEYYRACEYAMVYSDGYIYTPWDEAAGEIFDYQEREATDFAGNPMQVQEPIKTGDVKIKALAPIDVIFDYTQRDFNGNKWFIVREYLNKWELASIYPDKKEEIENTQYTYDYKRDIDENIFYNNFSPVNDFIPVYTLYHLPSPVLPFGRKVVKVGAVTVFDDKLGTEGIPLSRMTPSFLDRTPFGYSNAYDMLSVQRSKDILYSIILSNQMMFGVGSIAVVDGTNITKEDIEKGMNIIKYPMGAEKPSVLNFTGTPPEVLRMPEVLTGEMQTNMGVNSATRGNMAQSDSGRALAIIQAQTIQFASQAQRAYYRMREIAALNIVDIIRKNLAVKKFIDILGEVPGQYIDSFLPTDLDGIHRIILEPGNAATDTAMSRMTMANNLLQYGAISDPQQFVQIAKTGNLDTGIQDSVLENIAIESDKEMLMAGQMPVISWVDNHVRFIHMAIGLINLPNIRNDAQAQGLVNEYIMQRVQVSMTTPPMNLIAIGRQPIIPPIPGMNAPMPPPGMTPDGQPVGPEGEMKPPKEGGAPKPAAPPNGVPPMQSNQSNPNGA